MSTNAYLIPMLKTLFLYKLTVHIGSIGTFQVFDHNIKYCLHIGTARNINSGVTGTHRTIVKLQTIPRTPPNRKTAFLHIKFRNHDTIQDMLKFNQCLLPSKSLLIKLYELSLIIVINNSNYL